MNFHSAEQLSSPNATSRFIPRRTRKQVRFDRAFTAARADGLTVIASMTRGFAAQAGPFGVANDLKQTTEWLIKDGAARAAIRHRFGDLARELSADLDSAAATVRTRIEAIGERIVTLAAEGRDNSPFVDTARIQIQHLRQASLVLRWLRASHQTHEWPEIREALAERLPLVEAFRDFRREVSGRRFA